MALPASRIKIPDRIDNYIINPKWARFKPVFCMVGDKAVNILNGETATAATTNAAVNSGSAGKALSSDGTNNVGIAFNRDPYTVGSNFCVFMVVEASSSISSFGAYIASGTASGSSKPINYRLMSVSTTADVRFSHTVNNSLGQLDDKNFNLGTNLRVNEPSTVSASVNGTSLHKAIDGVSGTDTLSYAPASNNDGSLRVFVNQGSSTSQNCKVYMSIVFAEFIPNDIILKLHKKPQDFFIKKPSRLAIAPAVAAIKRKTLTLLGVG